jgi:hypothetical protein
MTLKREFCSVNEILAEVFGEASDVRDVEDGEIYRHCFDSER